MVVLRGILIAAGVVLLLLSALAGLTGGGRAALSGVLIGAATLLVAAWGWGSNRATPPLVTLGLAGAGLLVLGQTRVLAGGLIVFVVVLVAAMLFNALSSVLVVRRLGRIEFERVGVDDAVMPKSLEFVTEFVAEGFRCVGGYRWRVPLRGKVVTTTVLAGPDGDRYASITENVFEVGSHFGKRSLTTITSGILAAPPWALRQIVRGRPAELVAAHRSALELLAKRGIVPDRFEGDDEVLDAYRASEERWNRYVAGAPAQKVVHVGVEKPRKDPALVVDDERSRRRVDAWLGSEPPE